MITEEEVVSPDSGIAEPQAAPAGQPRRVLLAEDDRALRRFLEICLKRAGFEVMPVTDGIEAIKVALSLPVDVVVTDAIMPNLNGFELCRFIRNTPQLSHLPIVLLSGLERKERTQEAEQADAFLFKPVSREQLTDCLAALFSTAK